MEGSGRTIGTATMNTPNLYLEPKCWKNHHTYFLVYSLNGFSTEMRGQGKLSCSSAWYLFGLHIQQQQQPFIRDHPGKPPGKPVPKETFTHPIFISFFHLLRSIASTLFKLRAWQSFCTTSLHVLFGLPLGLEPSTSHSTQFFTLSVSCFRNTCPQHRKLFCWFAYATNK